jgi:hypothetical protein
VSLLEAYLTAGLDLRSRWTVLANSRCSAPGFASPAATCARSTEKEERTHTTTVSASPVRSIRAERVCVCSPALGLSVLTLFGRCVLRAEWRCDRRTSESSSASSGMQREIVSVREGGRTGISRMIGHNGTGKEDELGSGLSYAQPRLGSPVIVRNHRFYVAYPRGGRQSIFGLPRSTLLAARLLVPQLYAKCSAARAQAQSRRRFELHRGKRGRSKKTKSLG